MARLHEHQGKALLRERGVSVPLGRAVDTPEEARAVAEEIDSRVVVKIQAFTTSRKAQGGVVFADTPAEAAEAAGRLLGMRIGAFPVDTVLVEQALPIEREFFVSVSISDGDRAPVLLLSASGGSGVEERAEHVSRVRVSAAGAPDEEELQAGVERLPLPGEAFDVVLETIRAIVRTAREIEARSFEVNPLAVCADGHIVAADCRVTVDDYAVFRHPELGVEIAREFDHPPTALEKTAYAIEQADHRGTFYFAQLPTTGEPGEKIIGFHGAGGGGSMMSMDAVTNAGFAPANFTDTSGNPSSAKVYAAARVILVQEGLLGYFGSGSGVASQEQHHSAYGLAKAFGELKLDIPALVRLGGNCEDQAVEALQEACADLPAQVEGYKKDDPPRFIGERFAQLVESAGGKRWTPRARKVPSFVGKPGALSFPLRFGEGWEGRAWIDAEACDARATALLVEHSRGVIKDVDGSPALALPEEDLVKQDGAMIACEVECARAGAPVVFVDIPIAGLDDAAGAGLVGGSG